MFQLPQNHMDFLTELKLHIPFDSNWAAQGRKHMWAYCEDFSPTTSQDTLASQTSSCLPYLCIHRAPAKIHRPRKPALNHFPALAPITGIEVVRSKREGMQSILFACHQCHFAARQLEKDTHRRELLAAGEGAWQESLAMEMLTLQAGYFTRH